MQPTVQRALGDLTLAGFFACAMSAQAEVAAAAKPRGNEQLSAWLERQLKNLVLPKAEEGKLHQKGWKADIREALHLAQTHNRPVPLFKHDGRMATGRC